MLLVLGSVPVLAQSVFDGTWRVDPNSAQFKGSDRFLLQNGMWHCESCVPKLSIKADGKEHKVTTSPYYDAATVNEVNDHTVEINSKINGKPSGTNKMMVSDDGKTLTTEWSFVSESGQTGSGKYTSERIGEAPAGANKVSGTWQPNKVEDASESVSVISYKVAIQGGSRGDQRFFEEDRCEYHRRNGQAQGQADLRQPNDRQRRRKDHADLQRRQIAQ
jgi:hypothetical protein